MKYAETAKVEAGKRFVSPTGLKVETTGNSLHVASHDLHVHEVVILEGPGSGNKYLLNLDTARPA